MPPILDPHVNIEKGDLTIPIIVKHITLPKFSFKVQYQADGLKKVILIPLSQANIDYGQYIFL